MFARRVPFLAVIALSAIAAAAPSPSPAASKSTPRPASPSPSPNAEALKAARAEKRAQTLKYGTDAEIGAILKQLSDDMDDAHNPEILKALALTRNPSLKASILTFFKEREWKGAEAEASRIVRDRVTEEDSVIAAALDYGAAVRSPEVLEEARTLLRNGFDYPFARSAIMAIGRSGGAEDEKLLKATYEDLEASAQVREAVLLALAEMAYGEETRLFLEGIAGNRDERKILRMYAVGALGKGGSSSSALLRSLVQDKDPNVRAQAVKALAESGSGPASERELADAMRDSNDGVRLAAVQAAGKAAMGSLAENLAYRAMNDGSQKIREESVRALSSLGDTGWSKIDSMLEPKDFSEGLRLIAFQAIAEKEATGLYRHLRKALENASGLGMAEAYRRVSAIIGEKGGRGFDSEAASFVQSQDFLVRIHGISWIRRNKSSSLRGELERLAEKDADAQVRRKAREALDSW